MTNIEVTDLQRHINIGGHCYALYFVTNQDDASAEEMERTIKSSGFEIPGQTMVEEIQKKFSPSSTMAKRKFLVLGAQETVYGLTRIIGMFEEITEHPEKHSAWGISKPWIGIFFSPGNNFLALKPL